jgi:hypothetical protein
MFRGSEEYTFMYEHLTYKHFALLYVNCRDVLRANGVQVVDTASSKRPSNRIALRGDVFN